MSRHKRQDRSTLTTAQQLGSIIKSARDIMRKDKGLNGDLDRLPMLTWIMFLKFLDDMERIARGRRRSWRASASARPSSRPTAGATGRPTRRRHHRRRPDRLHQQRRGHAARRHARPGPVRLPARPAGRQRRRPARRDRHRLPGVVNRMINGYLLRDVINKVNGIHFTVIGRDPHPGRAVRVDAQGDARRGRRLRRVLHARAPVVRFMVEVIDPRLGETVLDPACGTGGFLVEAYKHLETQCQTVEDRETLQAAEHLRRRGQAAALPAGADEPAAARAGVPAGSTRTTACASRCARSATGTGWTSS